MFNSSKQIGFGRMLMVDPLMSATGSIMIATFDEAGVHIGCDGFTL